MTMNSNELPKKAKAEWGHNGWRDALHVSRGETICLRKPPAGWHDGREATTVLGSRLPMS